MFHMEHFMGEGRYGAGCILAGMGGDVKGGVRHGEGRRRGDKEGGSERVRAYREKAHEKKGEG